MKRFIVSVLGVTVFCIGLGAIAEKAGARFRSDEKALALIKQARLAIGGDQSIADVRSMIIRGSSTHTFKIENTTRTEQGETEIALQLPDKLSKRVQIGRHGGDQSDEKVMGEKHDIMIVRSGGDGPGAGEGGKRVIVKTIDGGNGEEKVISETGTAGEFKTADGKTVVLRKTDGPVVEKVMVGGPENGKIVVDEKMKAEHEAMRQNELLRTTLALLLTAPAGMDVNYTFGGETEVDGTPCNLVNAEFGGSSIKLFLSKASSLPVMISYQGMAMPKIMMFKTTAPEGAEATKDTVFFNHKIDASETAEVQVRFADYRGVNGVQLPYKWTTSVAGQTTEVLDVTTYELNPANIAEKFQNQRQLVRWKETKSN